MDCQLSILQSIVFLYFLCFAFCFSTHHALPQQLIIILHDYIDLVYLYHTENTMYLHYPDRRMHLFSAFRKLKACSINEVVVEWKQQRIVREPSLTTPPPIPPYTCSSHGSSSSPLSLALFFFFFFLLFFSRAFLD